jgi:hypothetical protein
MNNQSRRIDNYAKLILGGPSCSGKTTLAPYVSRLVDFIAIGCDTSMFWEVMNNKELCMLVCGKIPKNLDEAVHLFFTNYHRLSSVENEIAMFSKTKPGIEKINAQIIKMVAQDPETDFASHENILLRKAVIYQPKKNGIPLAPSGVSTEWVDAGGFQHGRRPTDHKVILYNKEAERRGIFFARCGIQGIKNPREALITRDDAWAEEFSKNFSAKDVQYVYYDFTDEGMVRAGSEIITGMQSAGINVKELGAEELSQRD